jgi:hypothetical protein
MILSSSYETGVLPSLTVRARVGAHRTGMAWSLPHGTGSARVAAATWWHGRVRRGSGGGGLVRDGPVSGLRRSHFNPSSSR